MTAANFLAYAAQVAVLVLVCAGLPRLLRLRAPGVQYGFWRLVLLVCLALPLAQPWRTVEIRAAAAVDGRVIAGVSPAALPNVPAPPASRTPFDWAAAVRFALIAGAVARLAWVAAGISRLHALRRRSGTSVALGFEDLQAAIGAHAPVLWSADVRHPVTFGLVRPVVLLPAALKSVDRAAQRAVVAHELHHVRRRDWAWVIGEEILRSVFWFHPAMWWLISRVQLARETVVDELSILATNARRTYLDTLLAFADDTGLTSSPAFSAHRHLFHRVMLLSKEDRMSSFRIAAASSVLVLTLGAAAGAAVNAFPLYDTVQRPAPPRDPLTPADYYRQAVEHWQKAQEDVSLTAEARLDVVLRGIAAVDRALVLRSDYVDAMLQKHLLLRLQSKLTEDPAQAARLIEEAETLRRRALETAKTQGLPPDNSARVMPPPPPPAPPAPTPEITDAYKQALAQNQPFRIGGEIRAPWKTHDVRPVYPPEAQANRIAGVVIVEAIIDASGHVAAARILRSIPPLDEAALTAVQQWTFQPTLIDGVPSAVMMTVTVNFTLQ